MRRELVTQQHASSRSSVGRQHRGTGHEHEHATESALARALAAGLLPAEATPGGALRPSVLSLQSRAGNHAVAQRLATLGRSGVASGRHGPGTKDMRSAGEVDTADDVTDHRATVPGVAQRTLGDGHDLSSPRFAGDRTLEAAFDNERVVSQGSSGEPVRKIQQALLDFGFRLPRFGADGKFGPETKAAVSSFQADSGLAGRDLDGVVGPNTMTALDRRGGTYAGPGSKLTPGVAPVLPPGSLSVQVPPRIRATSTPETMPQDRIPPRIDTPVEVAVGGFAIPMAPITLSVAGASGANGTVSIDGAATATLTATGTVNLRGLTQTAAGSGGNLNLVASQNGTELARSAAFSVAAVPQFYTDVFDHDLAGARRGMVVQDGWESDSGTIADLDQVDISEQVQTTLATGCFAGVVVGVSTYLVANAFTQDTHGDAVAILTGPGHRVAQQTCMFRDHRTGANDIPMRDSGMELDRLVVRAGGGLRYRITKRGKATTANGIPSGAGACAIVRPPQVV